MKKYLVEFIGTFFLMFIILASVRNAGQFAPIAIGTTLVVMVYAGGYISGAHYNPAVSLAVFIRGKINFSEMFIYWVVQIVAASIAAFLAKSMFNPGEVVENIAGTQWILAAEFIGTFGLAYVVLQVATSSKTEGNNYYGLAIGFTVLSFAYALGPISGGAFNPAVAIGASLYGAFSWSIIWIYLVACLSAGILAGLVYKYLNED
jgi:aquaporin Z